MIYNYNCYKQELIRTNLEGKINKRKLLIICIFISLFTVVIQDHFVFMEETVMHKFILHLSHRSFFSLISLYNIICSVYFIFFMCQRYGELTYYETRKNRWYTMMKNGYKIFDLSLSKMIAILLFTIVVYSLGFVITTLIAVFLKFSLVLNMASSLYLMGLMMSLSIVIMFMFFSTMFSRGVTFFFVALSICVTLYLSEKSGFTYIVENNLLIKDISLLFEGKVAIFTITVLILMIVAIILSLVISTIKFKKFQFEYNMSNDMLNVDYRTGKVKRKSLYNPKKVKKFIKILLSVFLLVVLVLGVFANLFIVMNGQKNADGEIDILGYVPYIFKSSTMNGVIEKNDFVVFKNIDTNSELKAGDVILYYENRIPMIKQITKILGDEVYVDVISYPEGNQIGDFASIVSRNDVSAEFVATSGWIGAWILFNSSLFGKLTTMVFPLFMIAFYDKFSYLWHKFKRFIGFEEK